VGIVIAASFAMLLCLITLSGYALAAVRAAEAQVITRKDRP
jgi:hypothetical protein